MDMDLIRPSTLTDLAAIEQANCVSILMPTHPTGKESRQDPIRLENLLNRAAEQLKDRELRRPEIEAILEPAQDVLGQLSFWQHQGNALAIYLAAGVVKMLRLPEGVEESLTIGPRFNIKPILGSVVSGEPFYVLALSEERARLFRGSRRDVVEIEAEGFPLAAGEVVGVRDPEIVLQYQSGPARSGGRGDRGLPPEGAPGHSHGQDEAERRLNADRDHFVREVAERVANYLYQDDLPLVLAADNTITGLFRCAHKGGRLVDKGIDGSPEPIPPHDLRQQAWEIVSPILEGDQSKMLDRFGTAAAAGKGAKGYAEVAEAAAVGKVDTLLFDPRATQPGWLSDDGTTASLLDADEAAPEGALCEDLVNRAVVDTLRSSGRAVPLRYDTARAPQYPKAILRY